MGKKYSEGQKYSWRLSLSLEQGGKDCCINLFYFVHPHLFLQHLLHGGHPYAHQATGTDKLKMREIGIDVEGEAVVGYPLGDADPDRGDLIDLHPDPPAIPLLELPGWRNSAGSQ
ncbi:hypothetical protein HKBW3S44_00887 [Candidatus Hakubella thermalkaliphila]|uniref:Uncharacterized protein n=1 Tax=Candidatus Hakubella thermalkaliphila TaxID=2754717 RepID=A0A6V8PY26_9ACTN|nr:hypothetical protein HKBW3S44_00887 [Candidatus Hakubella thermalkaliphila]